MLMNMGTKTIAGNILSLKQYFFMITPVRRKA